MTVTGGPTSGFSREFDVYLGEDHVGGIHRRGSSIAFAFEDHYRENPDRAVLGLAFEEDVTRVHYADSRMPWWFENLLPEGLLARSWQEALTGDSSYEREAAILKAAGQDLPGAVQVVPASEAPVPARVGGPEDRPALASPGLGVHAQRFSVAGVGLKFSMRRDGGRFNLPASSELGMWLLKMPDPTYPAMPLNEYATMSLASTVGIDVPRIMLVDRDQVANVEGHLWQGEAHAFAIERFDRSLSGGRIHIEDLAQVRRLYSDDKYEGNYETVANILFRGADVASLEEFVRRLAFSLMIGNADAHLKNWSLIYSGGRRPSISPAYDILSVVPYRAQGVDTRLALRLANRRTFDVSLDDFDRLARKVRSTVDLSAIAADMAEKVVANWDVFAERFRSQSELLKAAEEHAKAMAVRLLGKS